MVPIQYYLSGSVRGAKISFVCTETLSVDLDSLAKRLGIGDDARQAALDAARGHRNAALATPSTSFKAPRSTIFSAQNEQFISRIYAFDIRLYSKHCASKL